MMRFRGAALAALTLLMSLGIAFPTSAWGKDMTRKRKRPVAAKAARVQPGVTGVIAFYDASTPQALSNRQSDNPMSALLAGGSRQLHRAATQSGIPGSIRSMRAWRAGLRNATGWAVSCPLQAVLPCARKKMRAQGIGRAVVITLTTQGDARSGYYLTGTIALANQSGYEVHPITLRGKIDVPTSDYPDWVRYLMHGSLRMLLAPRRATQISPWAHFQVQRDGQGGSIYFEQAGRHAARGSLIGREMTHAEWTDTEARAGDYRVVSLSSDLKRCGVRRQRLQPNFFWAIRVNPVRSGEHHCAAELLPELEGGKRIRPASAPAQVARRAPARKVRRVVRRNPARAEQPWWNAKRATGLGFMAAGAGMGAAALVFNSEADDAYADSQDPDIRLSESERFIDRGDSIRDTATGLGVIGGVLIGAGLAIMFWPEDDEPAPGSTLAPASDARTFAAEPRNTRWLNISPFKDGAAASFGTTF